MIRKTILFSITVSLLFAGAIFVIGAAGQQAEGGTAQAGGEVEYTPLPYKERFAFTMLSTRHPQHGENPYLWEKLPEVINADLEWNAVPGTNYTEKLNTTLASGDLPDVIMMGDSDLFSWVTQGGLAQLDGLLDKYGANIKSVYRPGDMERNVHPVDGKIYGIHGIVELSESHTHFIRKDWLDELGLPVPETLDEWIDTLRTFRDEDPAGDGKTIPWSGFLDAFYYAFGIMKYGDSETNVWTLTDDDRYVVRYEHPNYRELLETLNMMYSEKLIDQEFFIRNKISEEMRGPWTTGISGAGQDWANAIKIRTEALREKMPDAYYMPVVPIKGPHGDQMQQGRNRYLTNGTISIQAEKEGKAANCFRFLDWMFSEEGTIYFNWGEEGKHHEIVNGKPVLLEPYNQSWPTKRAEGLNTNNLSFHWMKEAYMQTLMQGKDPAELDKIQRMTYDGLFMNTPYNYVPIRQFDTATNSKKGADIYPFLKENETKAIIGEITVDRFFELLEQIKDEGLDQITQEMNDAYQATKQ